MDSMYVACKRWYNNISEFGAFLFSFSFVFFFWYWRNLVPFFLAVEGDQNMLLLNMPLWLKDYFELEAIKKQQMQKELFALPYCLKAGHKLPFLKVFPLSYPAPGGGPHHWGQKISTEIGLHKPMLPK